MNVLDSYCVHCWTKSYTVTAAKFCRNCGQPVFPSTAAIGRMKALGFACQYNVRYGNITIDFAAVRHSQKGVLESTVLSHSGTHLFRGDNAVLYDHIYLLFKKESDIDMHGLTQFSLYCLENLPECWQWDRTELKVFYPIIIVPRINVETKQEMNSMKKPIRKSLLSTLGNAFPIVYETRSDTINTIGGGSLGVEPIYVKWLLSLLTELTQEDLEEQKLKAEKEKLKAEKDTQIAKDAF